ncbi:hypothetical protein FBU30_002649, partial [Linnemannia zychae]
STEEESNNSESEGPTFHSALSEMDEEQASSQLLQQQSIQQQQQQQYPNGFIEQQAIQWAQQVQQNELILKTLRDLTNRLALNPESSSLPVQMTTPPISLSQAAILASASSSIPIYGRYDNPNHPTPEFPARIPNFIENDLTMDLDEYLTDIELHFTNKNCPEGKKVTSFLSILKSGARQWAEKYLELFQSGSLLDWLTFKAAFHTRWRIIHLITNLRAEIEKLRYLPSEPLSAFAAHYLALANRIPDRSDKDKKLDFARKLLHWLQSYINDLHKEEDTLDLFLQKVVTKECHEFQSPIVPELEVWEP